MRNTLSITILGLAVLCTSQGWAGTTGNGWAQRNGIKPTAKTHYTFCYGGKPKVVYFSPVIVLPPTVAAPNLGIAYGRYLTKTYGLGIDGGQCVTSEVQADVIAEKKRRESMFDTKAYGPREVIETNWTGDSKGVI